MPTYAEEEAHGLEFFQYILNNVHPDHAIFGAFIKDELIGFVGIYRKKMFKIRHKADLWGTYVAPNFRNKGIGRLLVQATINFAKNQLQCIGINLTIGENNIEVTISY
jgi:GNAT superfamily N-acetyltransferase